MPGTRDADFNHMYIKVAFGSGICARSGNWQPFSVKGSRNVAATKSNYYFAFVLLTIPGKSLLFLCELLLICDISTPYDICVYFLPIHVFC